jgi:small subunit ribosomal protein S4
MGDPKRQRKRFETPRYPWSRGELDAELSMVGQYGLRNKRELWRSRAALSKYRAAARSLLGIPPESREKREKELLKKLSGLGMISETATLDDVLDLSIQDIMERRLQTIVLRKGLASTPQQARQIVTHGHVSVGGRRITVPGYLVSREEEETVTYARSSPVSNTNHPLRKSVEAAALKASAGPGPRPSEVVERG